MKEAEAEVRILREAIKTIREELFEHGCASAVLILDEKIEAAEKEIREGENK